MIYLYEHHVGSDPSRVVLLSLNGCPSFLLHTDAGLYGYHSLGGESNPRPKIGRLGSRSWFEQHAIANTIYKLYGACFLQGRGYAGT